MLNTQAWKDLERMNLYVNTHVKPMTDMEHWGVVERWNYPDDGYGDCEDYVLQKRRLLIQAGWPREALLITVVRDKHGDGHAILTVKTDKGEFVLDNQNDQILLWSDTGYRFVKRQSQTDQNVWVSLGEPRRNAGYGNVALIARHQNKGVCDPGHVPTPPRPQTGFARPALPQEPAAPFSITENRMVSARSETAGSRHRAARGMQKKTPTAGRHKT